MTKATLLTGMFCAATAVGFSGCGPIVPLNPTWKDDVRPLVVARCVRCHDDPPHGDPLSLTPMGMPRVPPASYSFNYPADVVLASPLQGGLNLLQMGGPGSIRAGRMPPKPAAALEDWQIEILEAWAALPR